MRHNLDNSNLDNSNLDKTSLPNRVFEKVYSRVKRVPNTYQPSRDPSTGWRCNSTGAGSASRDHAASLNVRTVQVLRSRVGVGAYGEGAWHCGGVCGVCNVQCGVVGYGAPSVPIALPRP